MGRINNVIEKYGLRDTCNVGGLVGQKMEESCIERLVAGDPSGNGKYFEWMVIQAGGGMERMAKSVAQWEKGDHGEPPIREVLRKRYIEDAVAGYTDDNGKWVAPVTEDAAAEQWRSHGEALFRNQHVYGDEDYTLTGFGFCRTWPGVDNRYESIVQAVKRFHRYQDKLKSLKVSVDLNATNYPTLSDLQDALGDITYLEIKNHVDADTVYHDDLLTVMCPFNIGASICYGHQKWCTANESMFKLACSGKGPNRWKEYAKDAALYYCKVGVPAIGELSYEAALYRELAVMAPFKSTAGWKFYDTDDKDHTESAIRGIIVAVFGTSVASSFTWALDAIAAHHRHYPKSRLNLEFVVR